MLPLKRFAVLFASALFLLLPTTAAAAECQFVLGFKTLRDLIGHDVVGECLENQHHGANGDGLQQTTGGLLVWRKADNWTAFTDGYRTWIRGPNGLEQRLNTEFLSWEAENAIAALPWVSDGWVSNRVTGYYEDETVQSLKKLQQASPRVFWELMHKSWIQSESITVNGAFLPMLYQQVLALTNRDEAMALRVMRMPFMVDLGYRAEIAWEVLNELYVSDFAGLQELLAHPELRDGITNEKIALMPLLHLGTREPESAAAIRALPWIHKYPAEVDGLQRLAQVSQPVFWAWMEHHAREPFFGSTVKRIAFMARIDEASALQIVHMPFLRTRKDGADRQIIYQLWDLAKTRPDSFRQILSHPKLQGGITDDHAGTLYLIILGIRNPQAAAMIEMLPWVQDGLGRRITRTLNLVTLHPSEFEEGVIQNLFRLAGRSQELLTALVSKPWLQDGLDYWEYSAIQTLVDLVGYSSQEVATARQVFAMPLLETIEKEDYEVLETLYTMFDEAGVRYIVSHPKLAGGIRDGQSATVALLRLEWEKPETAKVIWALPWVADGISAFETDAVLALYELAQNSTQAFQVLAAKTWTQDYLSADEMSVIKRLSSIAHRHNAQRDEAAAQRIAAMPFLETIDALDVAAIDSLSGLHHYPLGGSRLQGVLAHPTLREGITDSMRGLVSVLYIVADESPELLDTLLDPAQTSIQERVIALPLAGEVAMTVVRPRQWAHPTMDALERALRRQEEFMLEAFPRNFFALLIADAGRLGTGTPGIAFLDVNDVHDGFLLTGTIAQSYWPPQFPEWIYGGGQQMLRVVSLYPPAHHRYDGVDIRCELADNIFDMEQLVREFQTDDDTRLFAMNVCLYDLGLAMFLDLYRDLGDEPFRQSFRNLYLKLRDEVHEDVCHGHSRSVCYAKAAFVTDAAAHNAATADLIINRWYYGSGQGPP